MFIKLEEISKKIGVAPSSLLTLSLSGEFTAGKNTIEKFSFLDFLNRNHFLKRNMQHEDPAIYIYPKGKVNENLTLVKEKHKEVPTLFPLFQFINRLKIDNRRATRYCNQGLFRHYRIGSLYKLSEEDYEYSLRANANGIKQKEGQGRKYMTEVFEVYKNPYF